ncbi:hypothetical protein AB1K83_05965 [Sporosarcina sp. 179-K 3D1 HS]|uniref:hypothetical protein n=1 Tax=Sporosarcina sp. 179-K 3D1 HS TaxID=3232169 RepID=UPI0039A0FDB3
MINQTLFWTSFMAALLTTLSLKFLHFFHFIEWSPIGWAKWWSIFAGGAHVFSKWLWLFIILFISYMILYIAVSYTTAIPTIITALLISIVAVVSVEWSIGTPETLRKAIQTISIPFFVMVAIVIRFIAETAVFMKKHSAGDTK